jgi:hypothetical protein
MDRTATASETARPDASRTEAALAMRAGVRRDGLLGRDGMAPLFR